MIQALDPNAPDRRLLPEGRAGPMPWVIAIMTFLTVLATAAGLALEGATSALGSQMAGRLTVQIVDADPVARREQAQAALRVLQARPDVRRAARVPAVELAKAMEPWLGRGGLSLPLPELIDIDLASPGATAAVARAVRNAAPRARIDAHARWLAPLRDLLGTLRWLSVAVVLLMAAATAAVVTLAARSALDTHRATIDILHLLGATDSRVMRLFQRRTALDASFGGALGFAAAILVLLLVETRLGALGSELAGTARLAPGHWLAILAVPIAGALLATAVARLTVERALRAAL